MAVEDDSKILDPHRKVDVGDLATFICNSHNPPKWFFKDTTSLPIEHTNILSLYSVQPEDAGEYYCFGDYADQKKHFLAKAILEVNSKLKNSVSLYLVHRE